MFQNVLAAQATGHQQGRQTMATSKSESDRRSAAARVRAYLLWEEMGRPDGKDLELWLQAEREVSMVEDPADIFRGGSRAVSENSPFVTAEVPSPSAVANTIAKALPIAKKPRRAASKRASNPKSSPEIRASL
ncbi:MAG: hypothetical protein ACI8TX_003862 [Hyphomicrobiaceae bacterium]